MEDLPKSNNENLMNSSEASYSSVLDTLQNRFQRKRIYTNISGTLISVNPFESYPIYDDSVISQYQANNESAHIFSLAYEALNAIRNGSTIENIVFSGESGSGKSFNAKQVMKYFTSGSSGKVTDKHIDAVHTIFKSFATARTSKNENATRFGYAAELLFKKDTLSGLGFRTTLPLETTRVVNQKIGERNFHVFYHVLAGLEAQLKTKYGLREGQKFFYLNQGKPSETSAEDSTCFDDLDAALTIVGFSEEQRQIIYKTIVAILHIGNVYFRRDRKVEDAAVETVEICNDGEVKWAAHLLELDIDSWAQAFTQKYVKTEDGYKKTSYNMKQALDARDSLSQMLYEELFNWILGRIGIHLKCSNPTATINVVDCYGFERYMNNGLEQLLINTVNEKLENVFVKQMFTEPMENYIREGVHAPVEVPQHLDNSRVIELLTKNPHGLLNLLDDECKFPKGSDESYLQHCNLNHLDKRVYGKARSKDRLEFSVSHSGGNTWYTVQDFLHINKRTVPGFVLKTLTESNNPVISMLFRPIAAGREKNDYIVYAAQQFVTSSNALTAKILEANSHYIRCVRSNNERQAGKFDLPSVSRQIKAQAIVEVMVFRMRGFPIRIPFLDFSQRYRCLLPSDIALCQKQKEIILDILEGQGDEFRSDYKLGRNYVFLREKLSNSLCLARESTRRSAGEIIQKTLRMYAARKNYLRARSATIVLQSGYRGWKARTQTLSLREKTLTGLGKHIRRNKRLEAYREGLNDPTIEEEVPRRTVGYLDISKETSDALEESRCSSNANHQTKTTTQYLTSPLKKPIYIHKQKIEEFAELNYKGHLLEVRREPIMTPFLHKENEFDFRLSLEIFKLILKYMSDVKMSQTQLNDLSRFIVQQGILNPCQRDEILVQLCNQTYCNQDNVATTRGYQLMLIALSSFPPTEQIIPMLLSYFDTIPLKYRKHCETILSRRMRIPNVQVARLLPGTDIELAAIKAHTSPVIEVTCLEEKTDQIEAFPWITNEELARRILRQRGVGDPSGWTIELQNEDLIISTTGSHFFHDALSVLESKPQEDSSPYFLSFSSERTLPPVNKTKENIGDQNKIKSPVERRRQRSKEGHNSQDRYEYTSGAKFNKGENRYDEVSEDCPTNRIRQPIGTYGLSKQEAESDYSYTLPNKKKSVKTANGTSPQNMPPKSFQHESPYVERHKPYETITACPSTMEHPRVPPGFQTSEEDSRAEHYIPNYSYGAPTNMPMIQYVPVMMPQMMNPMYGQNMQLPQTAEPVYDTARGHSASRMVNSDTARPDGGYIQNREHNSVRGTTDPRIPSMFDRGDHNPSEYSTMSVASRIRRMPVPHNSKDVDRFLDEVFDQVLSPEDFNADTVTASRIAASIKGGVREQPNYDAPYEDTPLYADISRGMYAQPAEPVYQPESERYDYIEMAPTGRAVDLNSSRSRSRSLPRYHTVDPEQSQLNRSNRSNGYSQIRESSVDQPPASYRKQNRRLEPPSTPVPPSPSYPQQMIMMMPMQVNEFGQMMMMPQTMNPATQMMNSNTRHMPYMVQPHIRASSVDEVSRRSLTPDNYPPRARSIMRSPIETTDRFDSPRSMRAVLQQNRPNHEPTLQRKFNPVSPVTSPRAENKMGLNRIPIEEYTEPIVQNTVSNSEHLNPNKFRIPERNLVKEIQAKEKAALRKINERLKNLPPPVDNVKFFLPKKIEPVVTVEEKKTHVIPDEPSWTHPIYFPEPVVQPSVEPAASEWVFEGDVERPPELQRRIKSPKVPILPAADSNEKLPQERPAVTYVKQPWKLTIRKEMFHPAEQLDDVVMINQVFSQIIADCRRAIAYRIRAYERDDVVAILKHYNVPPEMLNRQAEIPTAIKVEIIAAARKWPLYFSQIYEVVEERLDESVAVLLSIAEHGIRLLMHTPLDKVNPLKIQDHFSYSEISEVSVESDDVVCIHTHSGMSVRLRTRMASQIKDQINKCLIGDVKERQFVKAMADYITTQPNLLSFKKGDIIELVSRHDGEESPSDSWLYGKIDNKFGNLPSQYVAPCDRNMNAIEVPPTIPLSHEQENVDQPGNVEDFVEQSFDDSTESSGKYSMMEFAMKYYRGPKGFDRRGRKEWTWQDLAQMVKWTDKPIHSPLLKFDSNDLDKLACETFLCIMRYMGDDSKSRGETTTDTIYRLLMICHKSVAIRDEVYCQIIRQTTNNKSTKPESSIRGWRLFSILTAYFECSLSLKPYLLYYLADNAEDPRRAYHGTAQLCLTNLRQTFQYGGRKYLLSGMEVEEITNGKILKRQSYMLPGGHKKVINTRSVTVVEEVIQELCEDLNIRAASEQQEFTLCYVLEKDNHIEYCSNNDYILDICTELEYKKQAFHFMLRRSVWLHPLRLDNPIYIDVMFFQIVPDYMSGSYISLQEGGHLSAANTEDVVKLGALLNLAASEGRTSRVNKKNVLSLIPSPIIDHRIMHNDIWADRVNQRLHGMDRNMTPTQARAAFLELLSHWASFGQATFSLESCSIESHSLPSLHLTIGKNGISLITPLSHKIFESWTFEQIVSWKLLDASEDTLLQLNVQTSQGNSTYEIRSREVASLSRLLTQYKFVFEENKGLLS